MEPRPGVGASNKLKRMDWLGTMLFAAVTVVWSVLFSGGGSTWSWLDARTWVLLAILVLGLMSFAVQQHLNILTSETWKIFPTEFLWSRALVALFIATAASASALYVTTYYTPLIFQFARGDTPISASIRIIPLMALFIAAVVVQGIFMPRLGPYMPWYIVGGVFILVGGALMCTVTATTSAAAIQGYTVLIGLGGGLCLQAAYAITTAKVKGEKLSSAISFINVAQIGAGVLSLTIAGAIYQNLGTQKLQAVLPSQAQGSNNIRGALAGLSSGALLDGNGPMRDDVATALTDTISKVFILVAVAGAVVVLSGIAMPVERLFYKKKQTKGSRSAVFSRHTSKVPVSAV
jgi:MFS family permease